MALTYEDVLHQLEDESNFERSARPRDLSKLDGIRYLLRALGNPEEAFSIVHIAGTNGKGSTALVLAHLLSKAGQETGCFTSPHLVDLRERIQINGRCIPADLFTKAALEVLASAKEESCPRVSFFDLITAIALSLFRSLRCDWVVLETGLGGKSDSTNVTPKKLAILTQIGLDHQQILGSKLQQIASEKFGIARSGVPLLASPQVPEVTDWLEIEAQREKVPLHWLVEDSVAENRAQRTSRRLAVAAMEMICPTDSEIILEERYRQALALPLIGRKSRHQDLVFEHQGQNLVFRDLILDGGHNAEALNALKQTLTDWQISCYGLLLGIASDKMTSEAQLVLMELAQAAQKLGFVSYSSPRAAPAHQILDWLGEAGAWATCWDQPVEALGWAAQSPELTWIIAGSFHMLGEILPHFSLHPCHSNA